MENLYRGLKQYAVPFVFPLFFTLCALILPLYGQVDRQLSIGSLVSTAVTVDEFAVCTLLVYLGWALLWLKIPSKKVYGPKTIFGQTPSYQGNGLEYYCASIILIVTTYAAKPEWADLAYKRMPEVVALLNIFALATCFLLTIKGLFFSAYREKIDAPSNPLFNAVYRFWCGSELHPKLWGVDIKQLIICRFGLMIWQQLIVAFLFASTQLNGFSLPLFFNVLLQSIYLLKFFAWESGYFHTIDIIEDRASYYLCWGTAVWVPAFYTWSTYYLVQHQPKISNTTATLIFIAGLASIVLNYLVDLERQVFRRTGRSFMPGKTTHMKVTYTDDSGKKHETTLLTSGFWGKARHLNYTFEISLTACWCLQGYGTGVIVPHLYLYFLSTLLLHRFYRDQIRCRQKYGDKQWNAYSKAVPYKLIPYIF